VDKNEKFTYNKRKYVFGIPLKKETAKQKTMKLRLPDAAKEYLGAFLV